jgi:hypothetical protein
MLGDAGFSFMVGYGHNAPSHSQNQAASCYPAPTQCNAVSSELSPLANPNVLYGALVEGDGFSDTLPVCTLTTSTAVFAYSAVCFNLQAQTMHAPPHSCAACHPRTHTLGYSE